MIKNNKKEDKVLKSWLETVGKESPGPDFTQKVMQSLPARAAVFEYKPVISMKSWIIMALSFCAIVSYNWIAGSSNTSPDLWRPDLTWAFEYSRFLGTIMPNQPLFEFDPTLMMSIIAVLGVFIFYWFFHQRLMRIFKI